LFLATQAQAIGFGGYAEYGHAEGDSDLFIPGESSTERFSVGFAMDTALAANRLINFRLTLGYQHGERDFDSGPTIDTDGLTINTALGFGVIRKPAFRLWLGPSIRLSIDALDVPSLGVGLDITDVSIGGGPVVGLNWNIGKRLTLSTTLAYQYLYIAEIADTDFGDDETFDAHEHLISVSLSFFFRTGGDRYREPAQQAAMERRQRHSESRTNRRTGNSNWVFSDAR
jgi:hypothetical protein